MKLTAEKNRRLRIAILEILNTGHLNPMDTKSLAWHLGNLGYPLPEELLLAHLQYLEELGYVGNQTRSDIGLEVRHVRLTAKGWKLIDGWLRDEGIDEAL